MLLSWVVFPLVLALLCAGWGLLGRELLRLPLDGALVVPLGFVALIVATNLLTSWPALVPTTVAVSAVVAGLGLARHALRARFRLALDPGAVLVGVLLLLAFGAPVILSGEATFAGYLKLDDTSTWLSMVDRLTSHGRSLHGLAPSTYALNLHSYLAGMGYPVGSFLPLGIGRALVGVDAAWVFQPFVAFCGSLIGLVLYVAVRPLVPRPWVRALVAVVAAQSALLYGYSQWGGIKELVGAAELALLGVLLSDAVPQRGVRRWQAAVAVAIAAAAVADTLGPGGWCRRWEHWAERGCGVRGMSGKHFVTRWPRHRC